MPGVANDQEIRVRPLLSAGEVARVLGIGERTLWRMVSRGRTGRDGFPQPVRLGARTVRWRWEDVETFLRRRAGN